MAPAVITGLQCGRRWIGPPGSSLHADGIGKGSLPFLHCDNCGWTLTEDAVNSPSWQRLLEKWT